jgi:hypothetical protein
MTCALLSLALTLQPATFTHRFKAEQPLFYKFAVFTTNDISGSATLSIAPTQQSGGNMAARVELRDLTMVGVDIPKRTLVRDYILRPTGIPVEAKANSVDELLVFAFAAMFLPGKPVPLREPFEVRWSTGKTTFTGLARIIDDEGGFRVVTQGEFRPEGSPGYKLATSSVFNRDCTLVRGSFKLNSPNGETTTVSLKV